MPEILEEFRISGQRDPSILPTTTFQYFLKTMYLIHNGFEISPYNN